MSKTGLQNLAEIRLVGAFGYDPEANDSSISTLPLFTCDICFDEVDHWVKHGVSNQLADSVEADARALLHSSLIVFFIVILNSDFNNICEHELDQVVRVAANVIFGCLFLGFFLDFDFCQSGPELDSLQAN